MYTIRIGLKKIQAKEHHIENDVLVLRDSRNDWHYFPLTKHIWIDGKALAETIEADKANETRQR